MGGTDPDEDMAEGHEEHPSRFRQREGRVFYFLFCYHGGRNFSQTQGAWKTQAGI